jgi:AraC-like DNA-binding protein
MVNSVNPCPKCRRPMSYYAKTCRACHDVNGEKNPRWKGGRRIRSDGYVLCFVPGHPYAFRNFVLEHRLVMEKALGRYLEPHELVHHKNEIKHDNRIENLELTDHAAHASHHFTGRTIDRFRARLTREQLVGMYHDQKLTMAEIVTKTGISYGSLQRHFARLGVAKRRSDSHWIHRGRQHKAAV